MDDNAANQLGIRITWRMSSQARKSKVNWTEQINKDDLVALPVCVGGLGLINPCDSARHIYPTGICNDGRDC